MPLEPHQIALACFEIILVLGGAALWLRAAIVPAMRAAFFHTNRLPHWNLHGTEVFVLLGTMMLCGIIGGSIMLRYAQFTGPLDREGMMVIYNGIGLHGFSLLGWPVFHTIRRSLHSDFGAAPSASAPTVHRGSWWQVARNALVTLALALPVVFATGVLWTFLLSQFGIEAEPQDLIGIFGRIESAYVLAGMFLVACIVAPVNEEVVFRGIMFRFLRQRLGRVPAVLVPAAIFGALHGNLAGFLPLSVLGAAFAIAYEQSGDLRVPIVAHAMFNLNTLGLLLSGLAEP